MNRKARVALMFTPLVLLFAAIILFVRDARHPQVERDTDCLVIATGNDVTRKKITGYEAYRQSGQPVNDVAIRCQQLGVLIFNDAQMFQTEIDTGQGAAVTHSRYDYLPDRWQVDVRTGWQDKIQRHPDAGETSP